MALPANIDTTYDDDANDASVKAHQQHHDQLHSLYNQIDEGMLAPRLSVFVASSGAPQAVKDSSDYVCDGTDDQVQINAAIDEVAGAAGGLVLLSQGTFHVSSEILLKSNVSVVGQGRGITTIRLANLSNTDVITIFDRTGAGASNVALLRMTVDGNSGNQDVELHPYPEAARLAAVRFYNVSTGYIEDVHAHSGTGYGIEIKASEHIVVWRCETNNSGDDGLSISDLNTGTATNDVLVYACRSYDNGKDWHLVGPSYTGSGFEVDDGPTNVRFVQCITHDNAGCGFDTHTHAGQTRPSRLSLIDCISHDNAQDPDVAAQSAGFRIRQMDGVVLRGCRSYSEADAIVIREATDVIIDSPSLTGTGVAGSVGVAIFDCPSVEIVGGLLSDMEYGIYAMTSTVFYSSIQFSNISAYDVFGTVTERYGSIAAEEGASRGYTAITEANVFVDVSHGLGSAPNRGEVQITPTNDLGNATKWWLSDFGATTFRINLDVAPGAGNTAEFDWLHSPAEGQLTYAQEIMSDAPFAYLRFEETAGSVALDETANNHDTTWTGSPTLGVAGLVDNAATLNGSEWATFDGSLGSFGSSIATGVTVEAWVKWTSTTSSYVFYGFNGVSGETLMHLRINSNLAESSDAGRIACTIRGNGGTAGSTAKRETAGNTYNDGVWHHIVMVWTGAGSPSIYVDGVLDNGSSTANFVGPTTDLTTSSVGASIVGTIDECAVYASVLSPERIADHFAAGSA